MTDTIFALSSGSPPAAIGVIRISGPHARSALTMLAGPSLPLARRATLRTLRVPRGTVLDHALVLWFPGPATATGEDLAELHLHGGRAVVAAVERALEDIPELRRAVPGEFTRRAFANGRIDLAEAEGLADLLTAETELERRNAMAMASGVFSRRVETWRTSVLQSSALVEAVLDFGDEDDVAELPAQFAADIRNLAADVQAWLDQPRAETLRDGFRVVLAGPPNAGKSTLFNALVEEEAAITASLAGTTRDVLTRSVAIEGVPFLFVDTAGLRDEAGDPIEAIGIERARTALDTADLVLWLGPSGEGPAGAWEIAAQIDRHEPGGRPEARHSISALTGAGMTLLREALVIAARGAMPGPGDMAINARQRTLLAAALQGLTNAVSERDPLLIAEALRVSRVAFDGLVGRVTTEDMLDTLFGRFCIGK